MLSVVRGRKTESIARQEKISTKTKSPGIQPGRSHFSTGRRISRTQKNVKTPGAHLIIFIDAFRCGRQRTRQFSAKKVP